MISKTGDDVRGSGGGDGTEMVLVVGFCVFAVHSDHTELMSVLYCHRGFVTNTDNLVSCLTD